MIAERELALRGLLVCGHRLLGAARKRDWEAAAEEQRVLHRSVQSFFAEPVAADDADEVARVLRELLAVHDTVVKLANERREGLRRRLGEVSAGRRAVQAYAAGAA